MFRGLFDSPMKRLQRAQSDLLQPGRMLSARFVSMGALQGRHRDEIVRVVGPPSEWAVRADGDGTNERWARLGYNIILWFGQDGVCRGVLEETSQTPLG